jgi:hypothetical protein
MIRRFKVNTFLTGSKRKFIPEILPGTNTPITRGSSVVERWTHNPDVGGANPSPASLNPNIVLGYN